jgi:serine/threonine-protein kinase RsbW
MNPRRVGIRTHTGPMTATMLLSPDRTLDETYPARTGSIRIARSEVVGFAAHHGATTVQLDAIRLAVSEAATNVVRHAYPNTHGALYITACALHGELWVLVSDDGCGHQTPARNPGLGLGLALIAEACSEFVLTERADGGTEARMGFALGD